MAGNRAPLKQSELTRYAKAMRAAGFDAFRMDVKLDGTVSITTGKIDETTGPNPCDKLLK
ncbi:hypothetical protein EOK75_12425 (plasmid) [Pseudorhodobacter turbinis]|uniref:Uncharacterized protein n=1 Tax=Pseudorhodobacter turbinis TaxID=2500533 RepID=A0A4P8EI47_9RHOB|nr:hypothetical protein [Pseudorhodobacter turbinis]QCO56627.1 hypothetical protein EOK75_12425 [Pseudorhodobacter turbinis]